MYIYIIAHILFDISTNCACRPIYLFVTNFQPVDPLDAACSSLESAMADCAAVTENALAIRLSNLKLHSKVSA